MVGEPVTDPRSVRPDLEPQLAEFLLKACSSYRNDRFKTAPEMRDALLAIQSGSR
jgi:hypothetical protein